MLSGNKSDLLSVMGWGEVKSREIPGGLVSVTMAVAPVMVAVFVMVAMFVMVAEAAEAAEVAEVAGAAGGDVKILPGGLAFRPALLWRTCLDAAGRALPLIKPMALFWGYGDELSLTEFVCLC